MFLLVKKKELASHFLKKHIGVALGLKYDMFLSFMILLKKLQFCKIYSITYTNKILHTAPH
jgi:hypothetical protein